MVMLWTTPHAVSAFETDWTRIWTTNHDGDDPIEKELLTRLAHAKGKLSMTFLVGIAIILTHCIGMVSGIFRVQFT